MKLSKDLEGRVVTIQLARPLYIMDYVGHIKTVIGTKFLCQPVMQGKGEAAKPLVMDLLLGVTVQEVLEDNITVSMITANAHRSRAVIPSGLIVQVAELTDFEPTDLPAVTEVVREATPEPLVRL